MTEIPPLTFWSTKAAVDSIPASSISDAKFLEYAKKKWEWLADKRIVDMLKPGHIDIKSATIVEFEGGFGLRMTFIYSEDGIERTWRPKRDYFYAERPWNRDTD
jgi:hypothetical protein